MLTKCWRFYFCENCVVLYHSWSMLLVGCVHRVG